jgi:hypothetical protein
MNGAIAVLVLYALMAYTVIAVPSAALIHVVGSKVVTQLTVKYAFVA